MENACIILTLILFSLLGIISNIVRHSYNETPHIKTKFTFTETLVLHWLTMVMAYLSILLAASIFYVIKVVYNFINMSEVLDILVSFSQMCLFCCVTMYSLYIALIAFILIVLICDNIRKLTS